MVIEPSFCFYDFTEISGNLLSFYLRDLRFFDHFYNLSIFFASASFEVVTVIRPALFCVSLVDLVGIRLGFEGWWIYGSFEKPPCPKKKKIQNIIFFSILNIL